MAFDDIITEIHACEICGHKGSDIEYTVDPISAAQWNKEEWIYMCHRCLRHLREGIYESVTKSMLAKLMSIWYIRCNNSVDELDSDPGVKSELNEIQTTSSNPGSEKFWT